ncbi:Aminodeoxychorismate lyase [Rhypophila decipiens]
MTSKPEDSPDFEIHTSIRYDPALTAVYSNPDFKHAGWNYLNKSPLYMLPFHRDRLLRAATYFNWEAAITLLSGDQGLETLAQFITTELENKSDPNRPATRAATRDQSQPLKLRISVSKSGSLALSTLPLPQTPLKRLFPTFLGVPLMYMDIHPLDPVALSDPFRSPSPDLYTITLDTSTTKPSEYTHFKTTHRSMYDGARQRAHIDVPSAKKEVLLVSEVDGSIMEGSVTTPYFYKNHKWVTPPVSSQYTSGADSGGNDGTSRRWALESGLAVEEVVFADSVYDYDECWLSNGARGFFPGIIRIGTKDRQ